MLSKEFLLKEYLENRRSLKSIAKEVGLTPSTIHYWMKKYNLPRRTTFEAITDNLVGKKFGYLTVLSHISTKRHGAYWKCRCDCSCGGTIKEIRGGTLRNGEHISCGKHKGWKGHEQLSGSYFGHLRSSASRRKLSWNLSKEFLWKLFLKQTRRCALSDVEIILSRTWARSEDKTQTASLDRIDSSKGYEEDNVQWVHKMINKMKQNLSQPEFINWCRLISARNS